MEKQIQNLTNTILEAFKYTPDDSRLLIGISGIPASGKSALARHLVSSINERVGSELTRLVAMDGWHFSREQLDRFEDPKLAHDRRGAAFTFDAKAFSKFISSLRSPISKALQPEDGYSTPPSSTPLPTNTLYAPTFSHSSKDPIQRNLTVLPSHRIVIIEGLYCNLNQGEWRKAAETFDFRIVSLLDREVARERLRVRHVATGVAKDDQEAIWRADNNDLPNGDYLLSHILEPALKLPSLDEPSWAGAE